MHLRTSLAAVTATGLISGLVLATPTGATGAQPPGAPDARPTAKIPTAIGKGGAVTTVDPEASAAGLKVLKAGGNAVDAAVAAAATLGVTEPYSAGIGGGGYFVYYNAKTGKVRTIDGRETAPNKMPQDAFIDPATGKPYTVHARPGDQRRQRRHPRHARDVGQGPGQLGHAGRSATHSPRPPRSRRAASRSTRPSASRPSTTRSGSAPSRTPGSCSCPAATPPQVGSVFRNPDLAATYRTIAEKGTSAFYRGPLARLMSDVVRKPRTTKNTELPTPKGYLTPRDLRDYKVRSQRATRVSYRGHDVYGMAPSSSGGTTVGEALNILERYDLSAMTPEAALHHYLEASALAFADRGKYVGDPAYVDVPVKRLLDDTFAAERACSLNPAKAATKPVAAGDVTSYDGVCGPATAKGTTDADTENISTTNLTVADKWGNVVEYTLTIEQTGGSGITVPGHGFLLNNELTDFSTVYDAADPNRIQPGKRPRSSMSPTIVLKDGKPFLALGSPGGSTIITTVLQMLVNRIDLGMTIEQAIAAPRASQRNTASVTAEPAFIDRLRSRPHRARPHARAGG